MLVNIINKSSNRIPKYATSGASGMDLMANLTEDMVIQSMERVLIPTGIYIEIPEGFEAQIRSRSGLTLNQGLIVANSPGTIDSDFRGEIKVILANISSNPVTVQHGNRVAQMVICPYEKVQFQEVNELSSTIRAQDGFGSTGIK